MNKEEEKEYYFDNMDDYVYNEYFDDGPGEKEYYFGSILEYADVVHKLTKEGGNKFDILPYFTEPSANPPIIEYIRINQSKIKKKEDDIAISIIHFCKIVKDKNTSFYKKHQIIIDDILKE
tara:strand:- start:158 stop:520 length:363 start_codon:yes stop_codon:yes gene_type:complete